MKSQLTLSQALERINSLYLEGTIEFYQKMDPNPWQDAHNSLELDIETARGDPEYFNKILPSIQLFVSQIENLVEKFRPFSTKKPGNPIIGGIMSNSEDHAEDRAEKKRECFICRATEFIRIARHHTYGPGMYCCDCVWTDQKKEVKEIKSSLRN